VKAQTKRTDWLGLDRCLFVGLALGTALATGSCRTPTSIAVEVTTDIACADVRGTAITIGAILGSDVETRPLTTKSDSCLDGRLGTLVVIPSGGSDDEVAIKVVTGFGRDVEACNGPSPGPGCVVSRRALRFIPHAALRVPMLLRKACDGVACGVTETCLRGQCVPASVDPNACLGGGCDEGALTSIPGAGDASTGRDASSPVDGAALPRDAGSGEAVLTIAGTAGASYTLGGDACATGGCDACCDSAVCHLAGSSPSGCGFVLPKGRKVTVTLQEANGYACTVDCPGQTAGTGCTIVMDVDKTFSYSCS
jgi:hypothetical protein